MHSACMTDDNCCKARGAHSTVHYTSRDVHWGRILGRNWEFSSLLFTITSTNGFYSPSPLSKSGMKLVCNKNIVYGNLKYENSQDYDQKSQRNCTFMNSASVQCKYMRTQNSFRSIICIILWGLWILPAYTVLFHLQTFSSKSRAVLLVNTFLQYIKSLLVVTVFLTPMETQS
jgi:hypothetical protein